MNKSYTDNTLLSMKKNNLVKFIRMLEDIIVKLDTEVNRQDKIIKEDREYIENNDYCDEGELLKILKGDK